MVQINNVFIVVEMSLDILVFVQLCDIFCMAALSILLRLDFHVGQLDELHMNILCFTSPSKYESTKLFI